MGRIKKFGVIAAVAMLLGCSPENSMLLNSVETGIVGAAAGAGLGALIGNAETRGIVGDSAVAGAAVGVGVGIAAGAVYTEVRRDMILATNSLEIQSNEETIKAKRARIEELRDELMLDLDTIELDDSKSVNLYVGPTIGVYK